MNNYRKKRIKIINTSLILHLKNSDEEVVVDVNSTNALNGKEIVRKYTIKRYTQNNAINFLFGLYLTQER